MLKIIPVTSGALLREFIYLPARLHANYPHFVPPVYKDEFEFHDHRRNSQFKESETITLLAYRNEMAVGRIMGIVYHPWNHKMNVRQARFYQLDCINDLEVCRSLIQYVENWSVGKGMTEIIGSFGFSDKDPQGIQVEGFGYPPVIASVCHQPYLADLVAACGYIKFKDCVSYRLQIPGEVPGFYRRIHSRVVENQHVRLLEFKNRKSLRPYFIPVMQLMNSAYRNIFGFVELDEAYINHLADQYLSVIDPALVKVVVDPQGKPVAFVIAMANISEGLKKAKGRLFPVGFIHILVAMKHSSQLDLLLGAVDEHYRGRGINVLMAVSLMETAKKQGMQVMDSHLILEENRLMRMELEKLGGTLAKRYRIFKKSLA